VGETTGRLHAQRSSRPPCSIDLEVFIRREDAELIIDEVLG
jgi:hypothetical protein